MATTEADAAVRRLADRPAAGGGRLSRLAGDLDALFDGTWAVRLTGRLPGQAAELGQSARSVRPRRSRRADRSGRRERFAEFGRPLLFRQSPLAPPDLIEHLDRARLVALRRIDRLHRRSRRASISSGAVDRIPIHDAARYVEASLRVHRRGRRHARRPRRDPRRHPAADRRSSCRRMPTSGRSAVALAVHDADLAGVLDVAVDAGSRGAGHRARRSSPRRCATSSTRARAPAGCRWRPTTRPASPSIAASASPKPTATSTARRPARAFRPVRPERFVHHADEEDAARRGLRARRCRRPHPSRRAPGGQVAGRALGVSRRQGRAGRDAGGDADPRTRGGARHRDEGGLPRAADLREPRL